jgi:tetratricopeptide (TPR) repeat protein
MNQMVRFTALLGLMFNASACIAFQDPEMRVGINTDEIFAGESIEYSVEIRNASNPTPPDLSALRDLFDVVPAGDHSRNQSSTTIINGRVAQSTFFSHVYQYQLTPKQTGNLQIPAPSATIDGKALTGRKLALRVIKPEPQDLVVVEMKTSQSRVYPTQPFTVTLTILVQPLPDDANTDPLRPLRRDPPHIEVNWVDTPAGLLAGDKSEWLQPLLSRRAGGFTLNNISSGGGFFNETAVFDLSSGRETRDDLSGKSVRYFKYELSRTLTGERFGKYQLGPAVIKGTFVSGVETEGYLARKIVAASPGIEVEVRQVPTPRPANYCGGIGEFLVASNVNTTKMRVGDPLTLTFQVKRSPDAGSLALLSAPDLSADESLVADFEIIDKDPTGRIDGDTKEFEYVMRAKRSDVSIPALKFSTFDPATETFRELSTSPIPLEVSGSVGLASGELVGSLLPATTSLKSRSEGIYQNITDPNALRDERVRWTTLSQWVAGVWVVSCVTCAIVLLRRRQTSDTVGIRRQQAKRTAYKQIAAARSSYQRGDTKQAMREVRAAVIGVVADSFNRVMEGLTTHDIDQLLSHTQVRDEDRRSIKELLESIEALEYGAGLSKDPTSIIEDATKWIARAAPQLVGGAPPSRLSTAGIRTTLALAAISLSPTSVFAEEATNRERTFVRALDLFDAAESPEQYREAATEFESILADGYRSGAVYYNLGNAYFRTGEYGRAILNYRKALPYLPRDPYLKANLKQAIAVAPGKLADPPTPWWSHVLFWSEWVSFPTKVMACATVLSGAALVLVVAITMRMPRWLWLVPALMGVGLIVGIDVVLNNAETLGNQHAVITGETIARKGTGNSYEPAFDQPLRDGAEFTVLSVSSDWTLGRFEGIGDGWVKNDFVAR